MDYYDRKLVKFRDYVGTLIGAEEFKSYVNELCAVYARVQYGNSDLVFDRALLLSIADGDGLDTWLTLLSRLWKLLLEEDVEVEYYQLRLPKLEDAENLKKTTERDIVLHTIEEDGILEYQEGFRILCIDISRWEDRVESPEFRAVLARLKARSTGQIVVFRLPAVDEVNLRRVKQAIEWFLNVDEICCTPYSLDEYTEYGMKCFAKKGITAEEGVADRLREIIAIERRKKSFCGFKTVRRIVEELIFSILRSRHGVGA